MISFELFQVCCSDIVGESTGTPPTEPTPTDPTPNPGSGESLLPSKCRVGLQAGGFGDFHITVVGGEDSKLKELPWTAILGYNCELFSSLLFQLPYILWKKLYLFALLYFQLY